MRAEAQPGHPGVDGIVIGVDEVGRGCLAGPVLAAAAFVDGEAIENKWWKEVGCLFRDSKTLSRKRREQLMELSTEAILSGWIRWAGGLASVAEIETLNIAGATALAMERALLGLGPADWLGKQRILVDGRPVRQLPFRHTAIVRGDSSVFAIAFASVAAKVERDRLMDCSDSDWPGYGFPRNAGYGTPEHRNAILRQGVCPLHRKSFLGKLLTANQSSTNPC